MESLLTVYDTFLIYQPNYFFISSILVSFFFFNLVTSCIYQYISKKPSKKFNKKTNKGKSFRENWDFFSVIFYINNFFLKVETIIKMIFGRIAKEILIDEKKEL